jgi:hypothetical protein
MIGVRPIRGQYVSVTPAAAPVQYCSCNLNKMNHPGPSIEKRFSHRANKDGSFDSICHQCFRTVASKPHEAELIDPEREHVCEDRVLDRFLRGELKLK